MRRLSTLMPTLPAPAAESLEFWEFEPAFELLVTEPTRAGLLIRRVVTSVLPERSMSLAEIAVTGFGSSISGREMRVPVTTISPPFSADVAAAASGCCAFCA